MSRFIYQTDTSELERRWKVTLEAMEKEGIDCLLLSAYTKGLPGAGKYLTDCQPSEYPYLALFGKEGISIFYNGPEGGPGYPAHVAYRNVVENVGVRTLPSSSHLLDVLPSKIAEILKKYNHKKVGMPQIYNVPLSCWLYFKENLPDMEFVDFGPQMDEIMAVKSEYELGLFRKCVTLHDQLMACAPAFLRAGRTEWDVVHDLRKVAIELDCQELNFLVSSGQPPFTGANAFMHTHKVIEKGDYFSLLIEVSGPGGVWGELGRMCCLGEPSEVALAHLKDQLELQALVAEKSKPGVLASDVFNETNKWLIDHGYSPDRRFSIHGQGYNIVDRPLYTADETMVLKENMFIAIHPACRSEAFSMFNCDNYIIGPDGAEKLNKTPAEIIVVDHFDR